MERPPKFKLRGTAAKLPAILSEATNIAASHNLKTRYVPDKIVKSLATTLSNTNRKLSSSNRKLEPVSRI